MIVGVFQANRTRKEREKITNRELGKDEKKKLKEWEKDRKKWRKNTLYLKFTFETMCH